MGRYFANEVLMVRPAGFHFNEQTSNSNIYQHNDGKDWAEVNRAAVEEFDKVVKGIRELGIRVIVVQDTTEPSTPDSIFPNNCFTSHMWGRLVFFPMYAKNRRLEAEKYIDELKRILSKRYSGLEIFDWRSKADEGLFLEGTGSMVLDKRNRIAYMALSERSNKDLFREFCMTRYYSPHVFRAVHKSQEVYHTNVIMSLGAKKEKMARFY